MSRLLILALAVIAVFAGLIPLDKLVDYFIYIKIIRDIKKDDFIEDHFNKNWLDSCGRE